MRAKVKKSKKVKKVALSPKRALAVAVAKDVLMRFRLGKLVPIGGLYTWIELPGLIHQTPQVGTDLQQLLQKEDPTCQACALGAAALSYVRLKDRSKLTDWHGAVRGDGTFHTSTNVHGLPHIVAQRPTQELKRVFSPLQLDMIEGAFEGTFAGGIWDRLVKRSTKLAETVREYNRTLRDRPGVAGKAEGRLQTIFKNIVRNKGIFVLPKSAFREVKRG